MLFPNDQIDGDHQVATVQLRARVETASQALEAAAKQFDAMIPSDFAELRKTAEFRLSKDRRVSAATDGPTESVTDEDKGHIKARAYGSYSLKCFGIKR